MSTTDRIDIWHETAMDLAEMAFFSKRNNDYLNYWKYIQKALNYEKAAAKSIDKNSVKNDPTRSILFLSATHFALNLDYYREVKLLSEEAYDSYVPDDIKNEFNSLLEKLEKRKEITKTLKALIDSYLDIPNDINKEVIEKSIALSISAFSNLKNQEEKLIKEIINIDALKIFLENKNLVNIPNYQIFEQEPIIEEWVEKKKDDLSWEFWKAYKVYLNKKKYSCSAIQKLDQLTTDILNRIGDPKNIEIWDKRGMVVGDVQSGKTSNYIGLINKAADAGFHITIILTGLYENLRQQTQKRIDEGFIGRVTDPEDKNYGNNIGVELYRKTKNIPVHAITRAGEGGDLKKVSHSNLSLNTNDYFVIVVKKNPTVLKALLNWLYSEGEKDGEYRIIKRIPLLVIDDEADYASINVDKEFVSRINSSIRAILAMFEQSAFIGYTATPFANVFITDHNETEHSDINVNGKKFRLGEILFPRDFIINIPPPSNYIGYTKVFDTVLSSEEEYKEGKLPMISIINDFAENIPQKHKKNDDLPIDIPNSLKRAIYSFILVCSARIARGQDKEHNSMLVHVSWFVRWIDNTALLINEFLKKTKQKINNNDNELLMKLETIWENDFKSNSNYIIKKIGYTDSRLIEHDWIEILIYLKDAVNKIEVRAVHGAKDGLQYDNIMPLNYSDFDNTGLSVIAVGGNKLSRGLTLEGLSISYFLRASRFYDTLLQMGRWFGYRPGYVDLCKLFTTDELITWYQHIANSTEELKEQFEIMNLAERTPSNFGLKVKSAPGMLAISSAAKIRGATDLLLSFSGDLLETYILSKSLTDINHNLTIFKELIEKLGKVSGTKRQNQSLIWENVNYNIIDNFFINYKTIQPNINPNNLRGYIGKQLKNGKLKNWTIVLINNTQADEFYEFKSSSMEFKIGCTFRKEVEKEDALGNFFTDTTTYFIRKSHIISPPHEYIDMDEEDHRYKMAILETQNKSNAVNKPQKPAGRYIRKYRGENNVLLLIYVLDTKGFGGKNGSPAIGYALSFPEIMNDEKLPYKVNQQFIDELFAIPEEAEENPEVEIED